MKTLSIPFILISIFFIACVSSENADNEVNTDVNLIKKVITLDSVEPVSGLLKMQKVSALNHDAIGPEDYKLTAIIKLHQNDVDRLKQSYLNEEDISNNVFLDKDFMEDWYPESVKNKLYLTNGFYKVSTRVCKPSKFVKAPYLNGIYFMVDDLLVICLYTT